MATSRSNVQTLAGTVMGAGTPSICNIPGTTYFMLQKGIINNNSANAVHVALVNGTAAAAGTVGLMMIPANDGRPFDYTVSGAQYAGIKIDQAGGLALKYVGTSLGTAGTVSAVVVIKDILL